ncbi:MAG: hypothetical protein LKM41_08150 [Lachnospiraceae bacterium]|jgi:uncharacterized protein YukE|nr:hypothetical protein [Lachnospiraceae bacterium]
MKTMTEILFNYSQAISQANALDEIAARVERVSDSDMQDAFDDLSSAWKSDSAKQYLLKGNRLCENVKKTAGDIREISNAIRRIAETTKAAEEESLRIATERTVQ